VEPRLLSVSRRWAFVILVEGDKNDHVAHAHQGSVSQVRHLSEWRRGWQPQVKAGQTVELRKSYPWNIMKRVNLLKVQCMHTMKSPYGNE
jgi:hypothetical protein